MSDKIVRTISLDGDHEGWSGRFTRLPARLRTVLTRSGLRRVIVPELVWLETFAEGVPKSVVGFVPDGDGIERVYRSVWPFCLGEVAAEKIVAGEMTALDAVFMTEGGENYYGDIAYWVADVRDRTPPGSALLAPEQALINVIDSGETELSF